MGPKEVSNKRPSVLVWIKTGLERDQAGDDLRRSEFYLCWSGNEYWSHLTWWVFPASINARASGWSKNLPLQLQSHSGAVISTSQISWFCPVIYTPEPLSWISRSHFVLDYHSCSLTVLLANDIFAPQFILKTVVQMMTVNCKSS